VTARRGAERAAGALAVAALALAVFWPTRQYGWLDYDDDIYVSASRGVALGASAAGLRWAFTSTEAANWFPLTRLSWLLDRELHGSDAGGYHATSALLHALAAAVLFLALEASTGAGGRSAFVAAVFAVHPLHVEPVAWIAARKDPLSGLFFALALLVYARPGPAPRSPARMAAVTLCAALGLMAKQTLVTLPFVLLLLDFWPLGRLSPGRPLRADLRRAAGEKLPLFGLAALMCAIAYATQRSGGTVAELGRVPLSARLANAAVAYARYLVEAVWPTDLAVFYPYPQGGASAAALASSLALLAALSVLALRSARRHPAVTVGWLWYLGTLVPVIGLVQIGSQAMADRYTYLPLVGLAIAVAWGAADLADRVPASPRARRAGLAVAGGACVALLALQGARQVRTWSDSETLMRHALAVTRDNPIAHAYLGRALLERGDAEEAIAHWREAARLAPGYVSLANNLAWLLATHPDARRRDPAAAVTYAEQAARGAGDDPAVLDTLATARAAAGDFEAAVRGEEAALALAGARGDAVLAAGIRERLALFRRGVPWVER
jgi:tetratricopeptide (TPR) repeat protein